MFDKNLVNKLKKDKSVLIINDVNNISKTNKALKSKISSLLLLDAEIFILKAETLLKSNYTNKQWYNKIYVDLLMAIETDIKSLIISLSKPNESPEKVYNKIRHLGHNINNLYKELEKISKNRLKLLSKKDKNRIFYFSKIKVSNRYNLVTFYDIKNDLAKRNIEKKSTRQLISQRKLFELITITKKLHKIVKIADKRYNKLTITNYNIYENMTNKFKINIKKI